MKKILSMILAILVTAGMFTFTTFAYGIDGVGVNPDLSALISSFYGNGRAMEFIVNGMKNSADKDNDGLTDSQETDIYNTDPTKFDTDGDGVSDGVEVRLNTNPLVVETVFKAHLTAQDEDIVKASVKIDLTSAQAATLSVKAVHNDLLFPKTIPGYMGMAYDFSVSGTFTEATLMFEFDAASFAQAEPVIYYYNELTGDLEALETVVNGNVASAKVTHFSTYILIDRKLYEKKFAWVDSWEISQEKFTSAEVVLVIDDSGSMGSNDRYDRRLTVAKTLIENLPNGSKIGLVRFDGGYNTKALTATLTTDREYVKGYLNDSTFRSSGGTDMYKGISKAFPLYQTSDSGVLKVMIVLSDGQTGDSGMHSSTVKTAVEKGIKIYTVGLGHYDNNLQRLADETNGKCFTTDNAEGLSEIYTDIGDAIDINTDSDADGIPDYYEDNMILFNGVHLALDKNNPDTDGDGLLDGEEVVLKYEYNADKTKVKVTGRILSDPTKAGK